LEGKEFRDLHEKFRALDCAVVGVSTDSSSSHRAFADKHGLPFTLLADERGELAQAFGVFNGKLADRATFVLDRDGRVARAFLDVTPRGHAQRVLNFVQAMIESHRIIGG
jgi:peroxiredoxin